MGRSLAIAVGIAMSCGVSSAFAGILTGTFTPSLQQSATFQRGGPSTNISTMRFDWTRTDAPGPGIDDTIPVHFSSYCIDLDQRISRNLPHTFDVITPAAAGFTAAQEQTFSRLWASFFSIVDTPTESAAFQLALWETVYDTNAHLGSGTFSATFPNSAVTLANSWLTTVTDPQYNGPTTVMRVLHSDRVQDQLTAIPTPGAMALAGVAGLLGLKRRR